MEPIAYCSSAMAYGLTMSRALFFIIAIQSQYCNSRSLKIQEVAFNRMKPLYFINFFCIVCEIECIEFLLHIIDYIMTPIESLSSLLEFLGGDEKCLNIVECFRSFTTASSVL